MTRVNPPSNWDDNNTRSPDVGTSTKVQKGSLCVVNDRSGDGDSLVATRGKVVDSVMVIVSLGRRS